MGGSTAANLAVVVNGVGMLLEFFLVVVGRECWRKEYCGLVSRSTDVPCQLTETLCSTVEKAETCFMHFCMQLLNGQNRDRNERFSMSVYLKSRGISNSGLDTLSSLQMCLPARDYRDLRSKNVALYKADLK